MKTVIIGGGIAGLYAAYRLLQIFPYENITIYEAIDQVACKNYDIDFHGSSIHCGAGIGRTRKDRLLKKLMKELGLPIKTFKNTIQYFVDAIDVKQVLKKLPKPSKQESFHEYLIKHLSSDDVQRFIDTNNLTDYLKTDALDALKNYGFDDNLPNQSFFSTPWNDIVDRMVKIIGLEKIIVNHKIHSLEEIEADRIILAVPASEVQRLLPNENIYQYIQEQSFVRLYAAIDPKRSKEFKKKVDGIAMSVVKAPMRKIIPISETVYMIAYCDNEDAQQMAAIAFRPHKERLLVYEQMIRDALNIKQIKIIDDHMCLWPYGTHFLRPSMEENLRERLFNPRPNIYVVGEAFSYHQGWTEGALQTIDDLINRKIIK